MIPILPWGPAPDFARLSILALVQGLTEFLPISSSGHLVLAQESMGLRQPMLALGVALHVGTLVAVLVVYRADLAGLARGLVRGEWRELGLLALASVPAAVVGVGFLDEFEASFHHVRNAALGLFATAAILLAGEWGRRRARAGAEHGPELRWTHALLIGAAQALAIWPGISRSGATIAMGMLCGLRPERAARFSFLLSIPAIVGASALQLPTAIGDGTIGGPSLLLWAMAFAGFVGWGALRVLLAFLGRGAFTWFAAYCVGLGTGALLFA